MSGNSNSSQLQPSDLNLLDPLFALEAQKVYDTLPTNEIALNLSRDRLEIRQKLGGGNFGCVFGGYYTTMVGNVIPVAIKMLKEEVHSQIAATEIILEAKTMSQLKHQNIVRLIGVCKSDQLLLVLELAPLGPINKYLRRHLSVPVTRLLELSGQIARGMAYLEAAKFVHRDLAARNVLLVNESYAKISDFGMSKALNVGHEYYRAAAAGRWPLKWYAPECIYYFRFNSKSDVWSYGVTLWEIFSFGDRPYKGLKGTDILAMLDRGQRLRRPTHCPGAVYELLLQCWALEEAARHTFAELALLLPRLLQQQQQRPDTHYQAPTTSSGSSGAKTCCYGSGEGSQLSSPPASSRPAEKWIRSILPFSSKPESAHW